MQSITIRSHAGAYRVVCGPGAVRELWPLVHDAKQSSRVFVLSAPRIWKLCGAQLLDHIGVAKEVSAVLFDDREAVKSLGTVEFVCRKLVRAGADRRCVLVALGGGVVGDVAGFVAASYLRGVRLVHVPTTLVAQVDSAIGGKTGVNLPEGKNLVGAFYPPKLVVADPGMLRSLPDREYRSGLYEVIKYAVIGDSSLFDELENDLHRLLRRDGQALAPIVPRCIRAKARVVEKDEQESGMRQILNFGHTLGHALEAATRYRRFLHGEAVAWGMMGATVLAVVTDKLGEKGGERILRLIAGVGDLPSLRGIQTERILALLPGDKKSQGGRPRWVLPRSIGKVEWGIEIPDGEVAEVLATLPNAFAAARGGR